MTLPLEGIKVLEIGNVIFAPLCARVLGDLGAEVIKVEPLEGEASRYGRARSGDTITFLVNNRNKRSLAVNLSDPRGRDIVRKLADQADVIVQNLRVGAMKKLGLDYESVSSTNPKVIFGSFYLYGETGPLSQKRGGDPQTQAFTGLVASSRGPDCVHMAGHAIIDQAGAVVNALAIVSALFMRERTGKGQEVTSSLMESGIFLQETFLSYYLLDNVLLKGQGGRGYARGLFPVGPYTASDGDVVIVGGEDDREFATMARLLGIGDLPADERYNTHDKRCASRFALYPVLDEAFKKKTRAEWQESFAGAGLHCEPCLDYAEVFAHPQVRENRLVTEVQHPREGALQMLRLPMEFKGVGDMPVRRHPPILGEHTREVLAELGYGVEETERLADQGAVGVPSADMFEKASRAGTYHAQHLPHKPDKKQS